MAPITGTLRLIDDGGFGVAVGVGDGILLNIIVIWCVLKLTVNQT